VPSDNEKDIFCSVNVCDDATAGHKSENKRTVDGDYIWRRKQDI
jgi:hypothetical protein